MGRCSDMALLEDWIRKASYSAYRQLVTSGQPDLCCWLLTVTLLFCWGMGSFFYYCFILSIHARRDDSIGQFGDWSAIISILLSQMPVCLKVKLESGDCISDVASWLARLLAGSSSMHAWISPYRMKVVEMSICLSVLGITRALARSAS